MASSPSFTLTSITKMKTHCQAKLCWVLDTAFGVYFVLLSVFVLLWLFRIFLLISVYYSYNPLFIEFLNYQVYEVPLVFCSSLPMCVCTFVLFPFSVYMFLLVFHSTFPLPASLVYSCMYTELCQCFPLLAPSSVFPVNSVLMCVPPSQPCVLPHVEFVS